MRKERAPKQSESWYALFVKTQNEVAVSRILSEKFDIQSLVPSRKVWKKYKRGVQIVNKPLFNSYVFVKLDLAEKSWRNIYRINSIFDFVRQAGGPAAIPEEQVLGSLKIGRSEKPVHEMEYQKGLRPRARVEVVEGPLVGSVGHFIEASKEIGKFVISVDLFHRSLVTELEAKAVRPC